jgi:antitoxin component YwqK of YwqJK toxin-antitoxin module
MASLFVVAFIAYSHFHEPEYFVGKDVSVDNAKKVWTIDSRKPVSGKVIFKRDGDVLLSYAKVVNGYVDTSFETYPSGKPKSEVCHSNN